MRKLLLVATALVLGTSTASAQMPMPDREFEIRPFAGTFIPVGDMADDFDVGALLGTQMAFEFSHRLHLVGTAAWTRAGNAFFAKDRTDIWQYDLGVEVNRRIPWRETWEFHPFVGIGGGGRTYDYSQMGATSFTCGAGYATLGTEFQTARIGIRGEVRNYLTCFESPIDGNHYNRYNLGLSLGLAYHVR